MASRSLVTRENSSTTPSSAVTQQSAEHVTEPVTEHVTAISSSTLQSDNANNVVLPTARNVSTVSATMRRPAETGSSAAMRQSPEPMGGRPVFMTSHPAVDATIPQTRHTYDMPDIVTTSDTFQPTSDIVSTDTSRLTNDSLTRQLTQSPTGASTQYMAGLSRGITPGRQTSRPATGATTRQTLRPPIGATTRRTAQQATRQPTPPRGRAQGPRSGPIPGQWSHGAPRSLATRENSSTTPSAAVTQQSAEHVTDHVTENVTEHVNENVTEHVIAIPRTILPRLSNLTVSSDSADSVMSPTALPNGITSSETSQPARDTILTETSRLTTDSSTRQLTQSPPGATTQYMAGRQTCRPVTSVTTRRTVAHPKRPPVPPRGPGSRPGPIARPPAHDASRTTVTRVTREDSDTTPSSTVPQQYAEHVTEHLTEHITEHVTAISSTTLPRLLNLTVGSSSDDNVVSPTALRERAIFFGVTVVPSTSGSPVITPASSSDNIHSSDTTRQSSEQVVETAQVTTGATTRHTVALRRGTTSGRQTCRPAAGATTRRTLGPLRGATTRQTSQKAAILKQAPPRSRVQPVRSGPVARPSANNASCSPVTRKNSDATPSSTVSQQSAEHVTEHVAATSSTTLPKQPIFTGGSTDNVTSPTALRERDSFLGVTVTPSTSVGGPNPISRNSLESLPTQVCNSSRDVSADTGSSNVTRQSSEPIYGPTVITASQPAATIPQTSQATTGATTRYTTGLSSGTTSGRQTYRPAKGATTRRTWQPPTGATTRGKSQQAATRQPAPPGGRAQGSRPGPIVNRENSDTTPSSTATQQSAEHVPEHMTEHVTVSSTTTLPKQLTSAVTSGSTDNIVSPTAFRERDSLFGVTVAPSTSDAVPSPISRTSLESLSSQVNSGPRHMSTVSATMRRPTDVGCSNATRQSSEPVGGQDEITSSQPAATTPRTSQAITGATTRYTAGLSRGATSGRQTYRPETGATTRRTWQSPTGATTRGTSQQATTRQLAPLRSRAQGSRPGPIARPSAHDASTTLVTPENTAPSSTAMQQSAEHVTKPVTEHMTEHVPAISSTTLPRLSSLTVGCDSEHNVVSQTALRERDSLFGVTVASSSSVSRSSSKSPLQHVLSSSRDVSADTATSDVTRQSSEPVRGQAVITSSQPAATTPQTSAVTTGATTRHTTGLSSGATSGRQAYRPAAGATTRRTWQPTTGATTRGISQQAATRQPAPPGGRAQGSRPGPIVNRENSDTAPSSTATQQSAEHVSEHMTEHVTASSITTLPKQLTSAVTSGSTDNIVSATAFRERDSLFGVTVARSTSDAAPSPISRTSLESLPSQVNSGPRHVSTVSANMRRPTDVGCSNATRQPSEPVGGQDEITSSQPAATTPRTSQAITGATTRYTAGLTRGATSGRQTYRPETGATTRRTWQSPTGATTRGTSQQATTHQLAPLGSRAQGPIARPSAHDASTSLVTPENTTPSSTAMQQSAEHVTKSVTEHMTEHVPAISSTTLPRLLSLTVGCDSEHNVVSPTALRERDSLFGVTVASSSSVSRSSSKSPLQHVLSSSRDVSADTATSDVTRQSSEPVRGQAVITSSQPAGTTPQTSQVTTGANTGHTTGLSSGTTSVRPAYRPAAGATTRRTRQQPTGDTTRGTSQQATTRQPVPHRGLVQGPRPGLTTRPSAHDASMSLVTRVNSGTTPSTDMQQSAEHVTQHVTEHVAEHVTSTSNTTLPRQSSLTVGIDSKHNVVSPTALRERDNLCDVTVAPSCSVSRSSSKSPQSQVRRSSRDVSADTATSDVTRQSYEPVGGRAVITTATMAATTPQTSHVTTGATTQYTAELSHDVTSSRPTSRPAIGATTQPIVRPLTGVTTARIFPGASTRQVKPPNTGSNRLPTPSRARVPGPGYATRPPAQRSPNTRNARDTTTTGPGIQTDTTPTNSQSSAENGRMAAEDKTTK